MKIRSKIFLWLLVFSSGLICLLWLFQVVFLSGIYKQVKISQAKTAMRWLEEKITDESLFTVARDICEQEGMTVIIASGDGRMLFSVGVLSRQRDMIREVSRLSVLTAGAGGEYTEYLQEGERTGPAAGSRISQDVYYCRLLPEEKGGFLIVLNGVLTPVEATVGTLKIELFFITIILVAFSTCTALVISRRVSKPIISINESAKELAKGRYGTHFETSGYREISELAKTLNYAAKELSAVDELRRELIANVSHDLRTPLSLIGGYAEAMRDLPGENTPENAQIIMEEARRLNRLVEELLDLSRLEAGVHQFTPVTYNLTVSLSEIIARMAGFTKAQGYSVIFEHGDDVYIEADESAVSQAVYNLLSNAINYTGEDKRVIVRQTVEEPFVRIEVADSGKNVDEEQLRRIWERYYRTGNRHVRAVAGSGIGLSIVKSVVEQHGGDYGVRTDPGVGTTFWIRLKTARTPD